MNGQLKHFGFKLGMKELPQLTLQESKLNMA